MPRALGEIEVTNMDSNDLLSVGKFCQPEINSHW